VPAVTTEAEAKPGDTGWNDEPKHQQMKVTVVTERDSQNRQHGDGHRNGQAMDDTDCR
jgi:hypothetical protein